VQSGRRRCQTDLKTELIVRESRNWQPEVN
jgi:hypothetical protein